MANSILAQPCLISNGQARTQEQSRKIPSLNQLISPDNFIDIATTLVAALGVIFVTLAGIVLSYDALWGLANVSQAINPALTWLWPLTLDALAIVASLNVLWAEIRKERDSYAWSLVITFTVLSVLFNALHASLDRLLALYPGAPLVIAAFVGVLPPVAAAFALHLLVRLLRRVLERVSLMASLAHLQQRQSELTVGLTQEQVRVAAETERLQAQITDLAAKRNLMRIELDELKKEKRQLGDANRPLGAETSPATIDRARTILQQQIATRLPISSGAELGRMLKVSKTTGNNLKKLLLPELLSIANISDPVDHTTGYPFVAAQSVSADSVVVNGATHKNDNLA